MEIVPRAQSHLPGCVELTRTTQRVDGYPIPLLRDLDAFLAPRSQLDAWVGVLGHVVVGHVALHRLTSASVADLLASSELVDPAQVGVVARLMVSPDFRRRGLGAALIETAAQTARDRHLQPVLDVVTRHRSAIRLYEREGWTRIGTVTAAMPNGENVEEYVFVGPTLRG